MKRIAIAAALSVATVSIFPQPGLAEDQTARKPLDNIVITANRVPTAVSRVVVPVSIVDSEDIDRSLALDLSDILRFQADIDVVRVGPPGSQTSIFTRGTESNHTLVMLDGTRINNGSSGGAPVNFISPDFIQRMEIVKAPRTTLYGEDAIGGVINILTKRAEGNEFGVFAGAGVDKLRKLGASGGFEAGAFNMGAQIQHTETDGFPSVVGETIDRGYRNTSVIANLLGDFGQWKGEARLWHSAGTGEYFDCSFNFVTNACDAVPVDQDYSNTAVALTARTAFTENWNSRADLSYIKDDLEQNQSPDFVETDRWAIDWQNDYSIGERNVLVGGLFFASENVDALSTFGGPLQSETTNVVAVYLEDNIELDRHDIVVAGRLSDHDAYGTDLTWNLEYGFHIADPWRLTASAGKAVRAPTAFDRFGSFGGNPDLKQEEAVTIQAGTQWTVSADHRFGLNFYHTDIDDLIASNAMFMLENIAKTEIKGVEGTYSYTGSTWFLRFSGMLQDPVNKETGQTLDRRSRKSTSATLTKTFGAFTTGFDFLAVGPREDFGGEMAGYGLTNLTGKIVFNSSWSINARVENLFDKDYVLANFDTDAPYATPDRGLYLEARYKMN